MDLVKKVCNVLTEIWLRDRTRYIDHPVSKVPKNNCQNDSSSSTGADENVRGWTILSKNRHRPSTMPPRRPHESPLPRDAQDRKLK